ncbi:hypothetical protein Tco_0912166, partial [Tanacetum coccineum]
MKQVDQYAQAISSIPAIVDRYIDNKLGEAIQKAIQSHAVECRDEAQAEKKEYIDLIDISAVSDFATPVIEKTVTESQEDVVLAKSSSQPTSTYAAAASLSEFKLAKILMDKMEENKSFLIANYKKELYDALVTSYNTDKYLFDSYGKVFTFKRTREDKDQDQDPSVGSDRGTKRKKSSKEAEPSKDEPEFEAADIEMQQDQGSEFGHTDDWFQKLNKPPTPDRAWNKSKSVDFRPPQKWISNIAKAIQPPCTFDELLSTPIDFSAYVINHLKIDNLTQEILVGPAFNLLKGTCKSFVKLRYHFKECYKAVNDRLDWHNPEGHAYPFDLSKPLPLIEDLGRQVVPTDYFINNVLEYLKSGSSSSEYTNSITRTKAAKYDNIEGIEYMVPTLWSPVKVTYNKHAVWGTYHWGPKRQRFYAYACHWKSSYDVYFKKRIIAVTRVKVMKWYDYGFLEEIEVRRDDNKLYKFKEGDFPRLNLCDIEDMLLLLVQKKLSNLDVDDQYNLGVALRIFTRRIVILHRVEHLQLGV